MPELQKTDLVPGFTLSSPFTAFWKFGNPLLGAGLLWWGLPALLQTGQLPRIGGFSELWYLVPAVAFAAWFVVRDSVSAVRVRVAEGGLEVSDYFRHEVVAWDEVVRIRQLRPFAQNRVEIVLRSPCRFGSRLVFTLPPGTSWLTREEPMVTHLREIAREAVGADLEHP